MCQTFGYTRVLNMPLVLNMPGFWIYQGYTGFIICLNNFWLYLNMLDFVCICLNMPEYTRICINIPKSDWMAFVLHFPYGYITSQVVTAVTYLNVYRRLEVKVWRNMRLFSSRDKIWFFLLQLEVFHIFCFCFRLNTFRSKIYICFYLYESRGGGLGALKSDIPFYFFVLF